jgi:hypothetical protein
MMCPSSNLNLPVYHGKTWLDHTIWQRQDDDCRQLCDTSGKPMETRPEKLKNRRTLDASHVDADGSLAVATRARRPAERARQQVASHSAF